jgi:hypothetical protein
MFPRAIPGWKQFKRETEEERSKLDGLTGLRNRVAAARTLTRALELTSSPGPKHSETKIGRVFPLSDGQATRRIGGWNRDHSIERPVPLDRCEGWWPPLETGLESHFNVKSYQATET